ncbi:hypothetical protein DW980_00420 [Bacteroides stercoris]|nr:hypothetical protein DW980_00420 [Bacteroides stercoris]
MERTDYIERREDMVSLSAVTFRRYWIARLSDDDYWSVALENNLWLMQQRYHIQANHIVTQLLKLVKEIKAGDVLLLTHPNKTIYAYGYVVKCPFQTDRISSLSDIISSNRYDYDSGIVRFRILMFSMKTCETALMIGGNAYLLINGTITVKIQEF